MRYMHVVRRIVALLGVGLAAQVVAQDVNSPVAQPVTVDQELQAAIDLRNAAQAVVDSLECAALFGQTQAQIDAAYPAVLASGVTLAPYPADKLFVTVVVPLNLATPEERAKWAEAKLAVAECGVRVLDRVPGCWTVHRNEVQKVFAAMAGALATNTPSEGAN